MLNFHIMAKIYLHVVNRLLLVDKLGMAFCSVSCKRVIMNIEFFQHNLSTKENHDFTLVIQQHNSANT